MPLQRRSALRVCAVCAQCRLLVDGRRECVRFELFTGATSTCKFFDVRNPQLWVLFDVDVAA
jgi:hypothetical protein